MSVSDTPARRRSHGLMRFVPLGAMGGLGAFAVGTEASLLALLAGGGAVFAGSRLWRKRRDAPYEELRERARSNVSGLSRVAREDRIAAPQMKRLAGLQEGLMESWSFVPDDHAPILFEDLSAIVEEVENTVALARRRAALRRHLSSVDRREISRRIKGLEKDLNAMNAGSEKRRPFESALASRRRELESYDEILDGIGAINAQLESAESLLSNLRGELLSVDAGLGTDVLADGGRLERLREQVSRFRRSLHEVRRGVDNLPAGNTSEDPPETTRKLTEQVTAR